MKIVYSSLHKKHHPTYEVYDGEKSDYPEVPERVEEIKKALLKEKLGEIVIPHKFSMRYIREIHNIHYVNFLEQKALQLKTKDNFFASYFIMDTYAPMTKGTFIAARDAVNVALTGAKMIANGERLIYSLSRPPGHHAGYVNMGGYCYFNNAAIAGNYLSKEGKVAILDIDFHHGNGTQQAFYDRNDVLYVSLHADPAQKFPYISGFREETGRGKGLGFTKNYPLPLITIEKQWLSTFERAIEDVIAFGPKFLVVSAGFDTYIHDPIGRLGLDIPSYYEIGKMIGSLELPTLVIQEGGYHVGAFGQIAVSLVKGLLGK